MEYQERKKMDKNSHNESLDKGIAAKWFECSYHSTTSNHKSEYSESIQTARSPSTNYRFCQWSDYILIWQPSQRPDIMVAKYQSPRSLCSPTKRQRFFKKGDLNAILVTFTVFAIYLQLRETSASLRAIIILDWSGWRYTRRTSSDGFFTSTVVP